MRIKFGKLIKYPTEAETCLFWYQENIKTFEETLTKDNVTFKIIYNKELERIYLLNDEAFFYVGIVTKYYQRGEECGTTGYGCYVQKDNRNSTSEVLVCCLNYSSYRGIHPSVFRNVTINADRWIGYPSVIFNYPYIGARERLVYNGCFEHCKSLIKQYDIQKIVDNFEGKPMCVAIFKIEDDDGSLGYSAICFSDVEKAHQRAQNCMKNSLIYCLEFADTKYRYENPKLKYKPTNLIVPDEFKTILRHRLTINGEQSKDVKDALKYIKYCLINVNDKPRYDEADGFVPHDCGEQYLAEQELKKCRLGLYNDNNYFSFSDGKVVWKSEFLVYQIVKKLYPSNTIYQFRPLFLKSEKGGQMSYDVFIYGLNIAIEYQGEQHFKPVDYFGGGKHFLDTQNRDQLKKKLSQDNGIKLIYINYDETINESLIKQKINNVLNKTSKI